MSEQPVEKDGPTKQDSLAYVLVISFVTPFSLMLFFKKIILFNLYTVFTWSTVCLSSEDIRWGRRSDASDPIVGLFFQYRLALRRTKYRRIVYVINCHYMRVIIVDKSMCKYLPNNYLLPGIQGVLTTSKRRARRTVITWSFVRSLIIKKKTIGSSLAIGLF